MTNDLTETEELAPVRTLTEAKLSRRLDALEDVVSTGADVYVAVAPHVVTIGANPVDSQSAVDLDNALKSAIMAAFPARQYVWINQFGYSSDRLEVDFTERTAQVLHDGVRMELPLDQLAGYWVSDGHRQGLG